jgi:dGTPase
MPSRPGRSPRNAFHHPRTHAAEAVADQFLGHDGEPDADPYVRLLQVADFVAGMTDSYAVDMYRKLKGFALPT